MATIQEALLAAVDHHQAGRLAEAEVLYGRILEADPDQPDALHLLGVLLAQAGRPDLAVDRIAAAVAHSPGVADYRENLAKVFQALGRREEAADAFLAAFDRSPERDACALGAAQLLMEAGDPGAAARALARLLAVQPGHAEAAPRLAAALARHAGGLASAGQAAGAVAAYRRSLAVRPDQPATLHNLGLLLSGMGDPDGAAAPLARAAALVPDDPDTVRVLATVLRDGGRDAQAADAFARLLRLEPANADAWAARGRLLRALGRLEEALACLRCAAAWRPGDAELLLDLGRVFRAAGDPVRATTAFAASAALRPDALTAAGAILSLNLTDAPPAVIRARVEDWARRYADPLADPLPEPAPARAADPDRPLRVGYLVENMLTHDYTCLPLVENHGPAVQAVVYALGPHQDNPISARYRAAAALFHPVHGIANDDLAALVRADGIDVLVDGAGFPSAGQRLLALARRPAPVQVHFPVMTTTGMAAVDALVVDATLAPPGTEAAFRERLVRVPIAYHFDPLMPTPEPGEPPVLRNGFVTFGSMNQLSKVRDATLHAWARVLARVPGSRLLVKAADMSAAGERRLRRILCDAHGLPPGRIETRPPTATLWDHYAAFNDADVFLDTFPYGGVTTTAQALWMGAPTVALAGDRVLDRYGASILGIVGLGDCVTESPEAYVEAAAAMAANAGRLVELRRTLRPRMRTTPLSEPKAFARGVEDAYRTLWRDWCAHQRHHATR
ncbi:tetratricopeptide repeat protein [Azospirillum sp.]|uniref:tetratricopeptide repeat protein n=1 Tax=Azospirillum sp. TaxID=34012 RepID=UPI002D5E0BA5|nr:tetratricopeptide repeat protein [Azospirillum sp.]HYD69976.1 tetratricopeptide repeat protein [Azospirillum sp.]